MKRITAILMSAILTLGVAPVQVVAEPAPERIMIPELQTLSLVQEETAVDESEYHGYRSSLADFSPGVAKQSASGRRLRASASDIKYPANPESVLTDLPDVRDQAPGLTDYGTCWAHAAIATAEIDSIKKRNADAKTVDYSELALAYSAFNQADDPLDGIDNDSNTIVDTSMNFMTIGGNTWEAFLTFFKWNGVVDESTVPYNTAETVLSSRLDDTIATNDVLHIKNAYRIDMSEASRDQIKQTIVDLGAVTSSYYANNNYYDGTNNSYYCNELNTHNHVITIVGWDDSFPAENFNLENAPAKNGAWLVRNSWGGNEFTYNGYFWLSYYDASIRETAYAAEYLLSVQGDEDRDDREAADAKADGHQGRHVSPLQPEQRRALLHGERK